MNKPTPSEIANMISENQYDLPMAADYDGPDAGGAGPQFDQGNGMEQTGDGTQLQGCAATACIHNQSGSCGLEAVSINEHGGCEQYEASADGGQYEDDGGRYEEDETGITGIVDQYQQPQNEQPW